MGAEVLIATAIVGAVEQGRQTRKAAKAQRKAARAQRRAEQLRASRARKRTIQQFARRRAELINSGAQGSAVGAVSSSGGFVAGASLFQQAAENVGFINTQEELSSDAFAAQQSASRAEERGAIAGAVSGTARSFLDRV